MTIKHLRKKLIEDAPAKTKNLSSSIVEKTEGAVSYHFFAEALEDKMSDDEFNKAMAALKDIWSVCPEDLPKDLSTKHDYYMFRKKK